jgi:hypothetical protein
MEVSELCGDTIVQFSNLIGAAPPYSIIPTSFTVSVAVPDGKQAQSVEVSSPDHESPDLSPIDLTVEDNQLAFSLDLRQYA